MECIQKILTGHVSDKQTTAVFQATPYWYVMCCFVNRFTHSLGIDRLIYPDTLMKSVYLYYATKH